MVALMQALSSFRRITIKVGSSLLVDHDAQDVRRDWLAALVSDLADLHRGGADILVVSSGAIALGRSVLGLSKGALKLEDSQAAAAVGQIALARIWAQMLHEHRIVAGQILVTLGDTEERRRYLNARATIGRLLDRRAVPVINENDTVATTEIRYGDNDRLAARVATMAGADLLVLLSDIDGLYTAPPTDNPDAKLIPLVDTRRGNSLLDRIATLRRDLARTSGMWVPPIRICDNIQLSPEAYRFLIHGREVARGQIRIGSHLVLGTGEGPPPLAGEVTQEPAFGLPARWIAENDRARAELSGFTVVDAPSVLITHLGEILRRHAPELLSREDLKQLIDKVRETSPGVVDELIPNLMTMAAVHRVLGLLLEEHVPISNLTRVLESLTTHASATKDPFDLTERVRADLGRVICDRYRDAQARLSAIVLDPRLEMELRKALHERHLSLEPARLEKLIVRLANEWRRTTLAGTDVALLTDTILRRALRQALARSLPDLAVIAYQEVPRDLILHPVALIKPEEMS